MSYRELWVLVKHLPPESWTQTALRDEAPEGPVRSGPVKFGPWSQSDHLTALLIDEIAWLRYTVARTAGNKDYPEPKPTPRPGVASASEPERRGLSEAAVIYLNARRAPRGVISSGL